MIPERMDAQRLELRRFSLTDSKAVFEHWSSDPGWPRFNRSVPADFSETDAEKSIAEFVARNHENQPTFAVVLHGKVIGVVGLTFEQGHRIAVIGYGVHGEVRGQGLTGEAIRAVIGIALDCYPQRQEIRAHGRHQFSFDESPREAGIPMRGNSPVQSIRQGRIRRRGHLRSVARGVG